MKINAQPLSMDVVIIHDSGVSLRDAHEAAKTVEGVRVLSTFVDGWKRTVSMCIATGK